MPPQVRNTAHVETHNPPVLHYLYALPSRPLPFGNSASGTPHHTTPRHTTPHYATPHHTTSLAVHSRSSTAHCPQAVRQCIAGVALPTASRQCGSALQEFHCPLPSAYKCSAAGHTQCSAVHSTNQCGTAQKVLMVQRGTHGAVGLLDPV